MYPSDICHDESGACMKPFALILGLCALMFDVPFSSETLMTREKS